MEAPSKRQQKILDVIAVHTAQVNRPPTIREIGQAIGIESTGHVDYHLRELTRKGFLERDPNTSRGVRPTAAGDPRPHRRVRHVPVRGLLTAGAPIEPISDADDAIDLPEDVTAEDAYALRVAGKSMMDDLIADGDLVVISPTDIARNGDFVLALLTGVTGKRGPATLKRYFREPDKIRLEPSYHSAAPIYVHPEDVQVQGKVIALIRKVEPPSLPRS